jgi:hypothetical protein
LVDGVWPFPRLRYSVCPHTHRHRQAQRGGESEAASERARDAMEQAEACREMP